MGSYCSGAHSPAFLPMSGGGELHSTAEPISCRRAWQSVAVPEKSTFVGWAPTFHYTLEDLLRGWVFRKIVSVLIKNKM